MSRNSILSMTPKNDFIFKKLFAESGSEEIVKDFLEAVLDVQIKKVELGKTTELFATGRKKKSNRLDVRVDLIDGTKIDIEMQTSLDDDFVKRSEAYASKLYINDLKEGMKYEELNKVIIIFVLNFEYMKETKTYHPILKLEEQIEHKEKINEKEIHFLELKKFRNAKSNLNMKLEQWMAFIDYENKEMVEIAVAKNDKIRKANEKLKMITMEDVDAYLTYVMDEMDKASKLEYAKREGKRIGERIGEKKGEEKGEKKGKKEVAMKLIKLGINSKLIYEATGIDEEEQKLLV